LILFVINCIFAILNLSEGLAVMNIKEVDLVIDYFRSSGPGGQHRNTTDSAVRIRHVPTGIVVTATESRSQYKNRERALLRLEDALRRLEMKRKPRIPTKTTRAAVERRITAKKVSSLKKRLRSRPSESD
jgi:protein subunit release factor A